MKAKLDYFIGRQVTGVVVSDETTDWELHLDGDAVIRSKDPDVSAPDASVVGQVLLAADDNNIAIGSSSDAGSVVSFHAVLTDYEVHAPGYDDPDAIVLTAEEALPPDPSPERAQEAPESVSKATLDE